MHGDVIGVILSVLLIGIAFAVSYLIKLKKPVSPVQSECARKAIHICVSNWFFIYVYVMDTVWPGIAGLLSFALINYFLEKKVYRTNRWGVVYFPISIVTMLLLCDVFSVGNHQALGCGILTMGYGDGLAAIAGVSIKGRKIPFSKSKSYAGSIVMFAVSTLVVLLITSCPVYLALLLGFVSVICEAYAPFGLDNIFVPVIMYLLVTALC